ncbi:MAG: DsrE family protein [SAR202 cluster bacterium]|nr:DsrE family protein [SAR202 cluster bacterium]
MAKILSVVERAYHGTLEEQDDTILWMSHILKKNGADINVLLRSNAVNYAVRGQDASGIKIGDVKLSNPPKLDQDVEALSKAGVTTYVVEEDLAERGIKKDEVVSGIKLVKRSDLAGLFDSHDSIWHW